MRVSSDTDLDSEGSEAEGASRPRMDPAANEAGEGTCTCLPLSQAVRVKYLGSSVK